MEQLLTELRAWLYQKKVTSDNIGEIRRQCFVPWSSEWNQHVRNETAARENRAPHPIVMEVIVRYPK